MHLHTIEDLDQQASELPLLSWAESVEQVGTNPFDVACSETAMQAATGPSKAGIYPAAILIAGLARHQFGVFESSNTVGKPARGKERLLR